MTNKTYKREVAMVMLAALFALYVAGMWIPEATTAAEALKHEVFIFAGGAFAMDAYAKQVKP